MTWSSKASQGISNDTSKRRCADIGAKSPVPSGFPIGGCPELTRPCPMPEWFSAGRGQFDGSKPVRPDRRGARHDAIASGKHRNAAGGPIRPTAGRVLSRTGVVDRLFRCPGIALRRTPNQHAKSLRSNGSYQPRATLGHRASATLTLDHLANRETKLAPNSLKPL